MHILSRPEKGDTLPVLPVHRRLAGEMFSMFLLWLISKGSGMHGYQMIKRLNEEHPASVVNAAHIYPMLKDMMESGLIGQKSEPTGRRVRKVYSITPKGRAELATMRKAFFGGGLRRRFFKEMIS